MNIALLILGVFFIILSIILITINSNNPYENNLNVEVEKEIHPLKLSIKKDIEINDESSDGFEIDTAKNSYEEKVIGFCDINDVESEDLEEFEEEYKFEKSNDEDSGENITNEIIKMYKDGLASNEIAEKLNKGIREIDIILKVNNISR